MKDLFVIMGMSAAGKSTMVRDFCDNEYSFEYFTNDGISTHLRSLFNVSQFSDADTAKFTKLDQLANTFLARYWLYTAILMQIKGDTAFTEGYRYYLEDEREVLEIAVEHVWKDCKIHYLHLNPPPERRNQYRKAKGQGPITEDQLRDFLSQHDLGVCSHEIRGQEDLNRVVSGIVGHLRREPTRGGSHKLKLVDAPSLHREKRDIEEIKVTSRNALSRFVRRSRLVNRLVKKLRRFRRT